MGKRRGLLLIASVGLAFSILGCGGGGNTTGIFPPPPPALRQLFFVDDAVSGTKGTLFAVDPSNPTQPAILAPSVNASSVRMVYSGSLSGGGQSFSGAPYALVYEQDGSLYRVDGSLSTRRVGKSGIASSVSWLEVYQNPGNPEKAWLVYPSGTGAFGAVPLGADNAVNPILVQGSILTQFGAPGAPGWLILIRNATESQVQHCDDVFANCRFVRNVQQGASVIGQFPSGDVLLRADNNVFIYYPAQTALSGLLYTFTNGTNVQWTSARSGAACYFSDGGSIRKIENSGYTTLPKLTDVTDDPTPNARILDLLLTQGENVVYSWFDTAGAADVRSVPKNGGPNLPLVLETTNGIDNTLDSVQVAGNRVFYNVTRSGLVSAVSVMSDGTPGDIVANAYWTGGALPSSFNPDNEIPPDRIFLVKRDPTLGLDNAVVESYTASTYSNRVQVGTLTANPGESFFGFDISPNIGSSVLGTAFVDGTQTDVFYLDANAAGSLKRVLTTPNRSEFPIRTID